MTSIIQSNCAFHWFYFSGDIFAGDRHFLFKIVTLHGISWFFAGDRHRMPSRAYTSFLLTVRQVMWALRMKPCQCPLGLIPHFYMSGRRDIFINFYVSMPSRAYTSFLRYPFKNLGFMRFPEPVFAGIYQNILTTAVFRAC